LTSSGWLKNNLSVDDAKEHYIHHLILSAPLVINNFLPKEILLNSESGGVDHTVRISEVGDGCSQVIYMYLFIPVVQQSKGYIFSFVGGNFYLSY
jgi:hypothetical protein